MNLATILSLLISLAGFALGVVNQLQIRQQMQRTLQVALNQGTAHLPTKQDQYGSLMEAPGLVYLITAINPSQLAVSLKSAGILLPNGMSLTQGALLKKFPQELASGADITFVLPAHLVLEALKGLNPADEYHIKAYIGTPLRRYYSKKIRVRVSNLEQQIAATAHSKAMQEPGGNVLRNSLRDPLYES